MLQRVICRQRNHHCLQEACTTKRNTLGIGNSSDPIWDTFDSDLCQQAWNPATKQQIDQMEFAESTTIQFTTANNNGQLFATDTQSSQLLKTIFAPNEVKTRTGERHSSSSSPSFFFRPSSSSSSFFIFLAFFLPPVSGVLAPGAYLAGTPLTSAPQSPLSLSISPSLYGKYGV